MRILYIDIDTLRPDHLGCYGYPRSTSPNIDLLAAEGLRYEQVYASDSPCLPSRSALFTGRFGARTGVVNHGGRRAELYPSGPDRPRQHPLTGESWPALLRRCGHHAATISTFGERHSAWYWYAGFHEAYNLGTDGLETADMVFAVAADWLRRRGRSEDWFLHVHFWDPHTPYRAPQDVSVPGPAPSWVDAATLERHRGLTGPHSAREVTGFGPRPGPPAYPRQPVELREPADVDAVFDGYDAGVAFADAHVGRLVDLLADLGVADETVILVSSDHGENLGELGIYCDHQTADVPTHRVPVVVRGPGVAVGVDRELRYQFDVAAAIAGLAGASVPPPWDGQGDFADLGRGRPDLILSAAAWTVQRSVRFGPWLCIWTYHDGYHGFPEVMLFDVEADPHERTDLAGERADVVGEAAGRLARWQGEVMAGAGRDPLWEVLAEGGGLYVRGRLDQYLARLRATGRGRQADALAARPRPVGRLGSGPLAG